MTALPADLRAELCAELEDALLEIVLADLRAVGLPPSKALRFVDRHGPALRQALKNDARYRAIRDPKFDARTLFSMVDRGDRDDPETDYAYMDVLLRTKQLDAAIDAEIARSKEPGDG